MEAAATERDRYTSWSSEDDLSDTRIEWRHHGVPEPPPLAPTSVAPGEARPPRQMPTHANRSDGGDLVELRNQVVDRLRLMNTRHGHRAWEMAGTDPISPYGLAFFYVDRDGGTRSRHAWRIATATRLFLDGPEVGDLPRLLFEQVRIADEYRRGGMLDPRHQLANRAEATTGDARYFGLGVSTVDLPEYPWVRQRQSHSGFDIVGRCFALLMDGTWLLLDRGHREQSTALRIWSSTTLYDASHVNVRRWHWGHHLPELTDPATRAIWVQLQRLHRVLTVATNQGAGHGH